MVPGYLVSTFRDGVKSPACRGAACATAFSRIAQAGLEPFLDKWQLVPGAPLQPVLEQALDDSETAAIFLGPSGPGPWHNEELQLALVRAVQLFGHEPDIARILEKLGRERFVAVVGPSGCGKSSLVLGGVLPRLKQPGGLLGRGGRTWTGYAQAAEPCAHCRMRSLPARLSGEQRLSLSDSLHSCFLERLDGLRTCLATLTADSPGPCVLVVDQLEELFTHAPGGGGAGEAEPFVANLRNATLEGRGTLRILVTLRTDFFDRCLTLAPLRELFQSIGGAGA